jgi:hypothetical protein
MEFKMATSPKTVALLTAAQVTSDIASAVGKRIGKSNLSLDRLFQAVKQQPLVAGLTIAELYGVGSSAWQQFVADHPQTADTLEILKEEVTEVQQDVTIASADLVDEMRNITDACRSIGVSFHDLLLLRRVLGFSDAHFTHYASNMANRNIYLSR